jgi:hypothetical protein
MRIGIQNKNKEENPAARLEGDEQEIPRDGMLCGRGRGAFSSIRR